MAESATKLDLRTVPIYRRRRTAPAAVGAPRLAWALFLLLGLPFGLMAILSVLARGGIYVDLFRPFWQPWPPDLLKPFLGLTVFVATLAYLTYRLGRRTGYRTGTVAGIASERRWTEEHHAPPPPVPAAPSADRVVVAGPPHPAPEENAQSAFEDDL